MRITLKVQSGALSTSIQRRLDSSIEQGCWDTLTNQHVPNTTTPRDARVHECAF